jgi:arginine decarboxylase
MADTIAALDNDEFYLDPTRLTLLCGAAGYDGTQFKALLASEHDKQINKTSSNSVLAQININNTRSDLAHLIKALADMARDIDTRLAEGGEDARAAFTRLAKGPELVSAKFVIPYPPGFPIMVPGQVITKEIITFMRKLDVKEIHGYKAAKGLELLKPETLRQHTRAA